MKDINQILQEQVNEATGDFSSLQKIDEKLLIGLVEKHIRKEAKEPFKVKKVTNYAKSHYGEQPRYFMFYFDGSDGGKYEAHFIVRDLKFQRNGVFFSVELIEWIGA